MAALASSTNPLEEKTMDFLMRMKNYTIARADQDGGLPVGTSGYILDTDLNLSNDKYKGRNIRIKHSNPKIGGFDINMVIIVDDLTRDEKVIARMAIFPSFWDGDEFDWIDCLDDEEKDGFDVEFAVFIGMLSQWASAYVYNALVSFFEDDPKQLKYYLPVLAFGYLNQYTNYFHLNDTDAMNKAFEDLGYFVDKHCSPFIQDRYARLMIEREARRSKRAKTHGVASD